MAKQNLGAKKTRPRASAKKRQHLTTPYRARLVPIRLVPHKHSGRRLPYYCTSYAALFFLLAFTSLMVLMSSHYVSAIQESSAIEIGGVVKGKPPDQAAAVTYPKSGTRVTNPQQTISGSCLQDKYIEIYSNNIFVGMTLCSANGDFSLDVTILPGQNDIVAKTRDTLGQYGPDSSVIVVFLNDDLPKGSEPLVLYTKPTQWGTFLGKQFSIDWTITGGQPPYAVSINWDDSTTDELVSRPKSGSYTSSHVFAQTGLREIKFHAIDSSNQAANIQTIVVVNGDAGSNAIPSGLCAAGDPKIAQEAIIKGYCDINASQELIDKIWPVMIASTVMTGSFMVGEQVVLRQVRPHRFRFFKR